MEALRAHELQVDVLAEEAPEHGADRIHDVVEDERRGLEQLPTAEGEELPRERLGPLSGADDLREVLLERVFRRE